MFRGSSFFILIMMWNHTATNRAGNPSIPRGVRSKRKRALVCRCAVLELVRKEGHDGLARCYQLQSCTCMLLRMYGFN